MSPISNWPNNACVGTPKISIDSLLRRLLVIVPQPGPGRRSPGRLRMSPWPAGLLHQRAVAVLERAEGLVGRDGGAQLVVVVRTLGLRGLLHLEQVRRMDL